MKHKYRLNIFEKLVLNLTPRFIRNIYTKPLMKEMKYMNNSYSQEGEDLILARYFGNINRNGFYVDVGAYHPKKFSNTYYFYQKGWRGINIDATPGSMKEFDLIRPGDINIESAISDEDETLEYYLFNEPALNSFDRRRSLEVDKDERYNFHIIGKKRMKTHRLDNILDKHLPERKTIDFMNIDVENYDLKVINSNNWEKYRPTFVLVEDLEINSRKMKDSPMLNFFSELNFEFFAKTVFTVIFKDKSVVVPHI